ncbi:MAG: hypothetical protein Q8P05_04120 [Candidatus Diapherotrites archaeon]|nr:hypothetical protein [Candidatus Diapherotrites archaeon]MDZ4256922.1 hypothetical protein [archaeon]
MAAKRKKSTRTRKGARRKGSITSGVTRRVRKTASGISKAATNTEKRIRQAVTSPRARQTVRATRDKAHELRDVAAMVTAGAYAVEAGANAILEALETEAKKAHRAVTKPARRKKRRR